LASGTSGSNQSLGIDVSGATALGQQAAAANGARLLAKFVDDNFYAGNFAAPSTNVDRRCSAVSDDGGPDEPPSFVASCCVPMEIGTAAAPPAQAGRAAVRAQGASEALARSFAQQGSARGGITWSDEPPALVAWNAGARPGGDLMAQLQAMHPNEEVHMFHRDASGEEHVTRVAPRFPTTEREQHEVEPVYDPELGVAPKFTAVCDGAGARVVRDTAGNAIAWPWEGCNTLGTPWHLHAKTAEQIDCFSYRKEGCLPSKSATFLPGAFAFQSVEDDLPLVDHAAKYFAAPAPNLDPLGSHKADATVLAGLNAATDDGKGGENSTGVRAYKAFCAKHGRAILRPIDPNAPLWVKLSEEQWAMRFISELIDDRVITVDTARSYFGAASKWHLRKTGIGFAAGVCMKRLGEMVEGLKKLRDGPTAPVRHGISPDQLRRGMDIVFPPTSPENVNIRAMMSTQLQSLMRGREVGCEGTFDQAIDLARGDIATADEHRLAFFMRPAKNMRHRRGKTVPIVIGGGGNMIDSCAEVKRMLEMDPAPPGRAASTPMFRKPDGSAFTTDDIRNIVRQIVAAIGLDPALYGAHSLRIGGATALFAAGADPIHIRTMGRWSSDCYRLYVRSCFEQTLAWTAKIGSQSVHDVQGTYERQAQETEYY